MEVAVGASAAGARVLATMKLRRRERGGRPAVHRQPTPAWAAASVDLGRRRSRACTPPRTSRTRHYYAQRRRTSPCLEPGRLRRGAALRPRGLRQLSERFDVPVLIRSTRARLPHEDPESSRGSAKPRRASQALSRANPAKWVMMPAFAKPRRKVQLAAHRQRYAQWVRKPAPTTRCEKGRAPSASSARARPTSTWPRRSRMRSIFKLGVTWPLARGGAARFRRRAWIAAVRGGGGLGPTSETQCVHCGVRGVDDFRAPACRATASCTARARAARRSASRRPRARAGCLTDVPGRPPGAVRRAARIASCSRSSRACKAIVTGDIGCYTLGRPAAAFGHGHHASTWAPPFPWPTASSWRWPAREHRPIVAVIGDSTFAHSGLSRAHHHGVQQGRWHGLRARQPHHRHDGPPGQPLQRRDAAEPAQRASLNLAGRAWRPSASRMCAWSIPTMRGAVRRALKEATGSDDTLRHRVPLRLACCIERARRAVAMS